MHGWPFPFPGAPGRLSGRACLKLAHSRRGQKFRNVSADPRVSVSLADPDNPYRSLEVRGVASAADDPGGAFFTDLARRYGYAPRRGPACRTGLSYRCA